MTRLKQLLDINVLKKVGPSRTIIVFLLLVSTQPLMAVCFDGKGVTPTTPTADFEFITNDTVLHKKTRLMWRRCPVGFGITGPSGAQVCTKPFRPTDFEFLWEKALLASSRKTLDGYSGWRVPNIKELQSIKEFACSPNLNPEVFPVDFSKGPSYFWSSTPAVPTSSNPPEQQAYTVGYDGGGLGRGNVTSFLSVLLVRDTEADFASTIAPAFQHPRCQNCHAVKATNFVSGGDANGVGLPSGHPPVNATTPNTTCESCHTTDLQPPGDIDPGWHAAALGDDLRDLTLAELCVRASTVPNSANNAHHHLTEDRLVVWAFDPKKPFGGEFDAAPPYNVEAWRDAIDLWRDYGLECPQ